MATNFVYIEQVTDVGALRYNVVWVSKDGSDRGWSRVVGSFSERRFAELFLSAIKEQGYVT